MNKKLIGVDLGGTTIKFAILTDQGEIQQKWSLRTNILDEGSHIVPDIIESINHHIDLYKIRPSYHGKENPHQQISRKTPSYLVSVFHTQHQQKPAITP